MHRRQGRGRARAITLGVAMLAVTACGGVTKFADTTAISIKGPAIEAPPEPPKRVEVKADRIEITEKIQFELDKAIIRPESHGLLDEIVQVIRENTHIKKVDIIGHTSDEGSDVYNMSLSDKRAKAVMEYLTSHGIDKGRLNAKGLGESQPLSENTNEKNREANRRVEFLIVEQDLKTSAEVEEPAKQDKRSAKASENAEGAR